MGKIFLQNEDYLPDGWTFERIEKLVEARKPKTLTKEALSKIISKKYLNMTEDDLIKYLEEREKDVTTINMPLPIDKSRMAYAEGVENDNFDFNNTYDELDTLYEQWLLTEKKQKNKNDEQGSKKESWKDKFLSFDTINVSVPKGVFEPLISHEFADSYNNFTNTFGADDTKKLAAKISYVIETFEANGRSKPGNSEKVNGVAYSIWELKLGETSSRKPIRALYFIKTDDNGVKYVIFASLFIHTDKKLTAIERNSGEKAYFTVNPKK